MFAGGWCAISRASFAPHPGSTVQGCLALFGTALVDIGGSCHKNRDRLLIIASRGPVKRRKPIFIGGTCVGAVLKERCANGVGHVQLLVQRSVMQQREQHRRRRAAAVATTTTTNTNTNRRTRETPPD